MYVSVRRYNITDTESVEEISRRVKEGAVPLISQTPGFIAYYLADGGERVVVSISLFDDQAGAEASNRIAADWVKENLAPVVVGRPQVTAGQVTVHKTK